MEINPMYYTFSVPSIYYFTRSREKREKEIKTCSTAGIDVL